MTHWFRPKRYGYGASPANWRGWAALAVFVLLVAAAQFEEQSAPAGQTIIGSISATAVLTLAFICIARRKTEGTWRWRWGSGRGDN